MTTTFRVGDRVRLKSGSGVGVVKQVIEPHHLAVSLDGGLFTMVWPAEDFEPVPPIEVTFGCADDPEPHQKFAPLLTITSTANANAWCPHSFMYVDSRTCTNCSATLMAFHSWEVEAAKAHGSAAYESMAADVAQVKALARAMWIRTLPLHEHGQTLGDWARVANILPPKPGKREQWADAVLAAACDRLALEYE